MALRYTSTYNYQPQVLIFFPRPCDRGKWSMKKGLPNMGKERTNNGMDMEAILMCVPAEWWVPLLPVSSSLATTHI